jgi:endonuclease/exonuclease/phosphatase family metal-dependent hydrolase
MRALLMLALLFTQDEPKKLTVATYNVLADEKTADARCPALFKILKDSEADLIALQEVEEWFLKRLVKEEWAKPYHLALPDGKLDRGGQLILSKRKITRTKVKTLPGEQQRTVLVAWLEGGLAVATTHMESPLEEGAIRAKQLKAIFQVLQNDTEAILLGDLNFGDGEKPDSAELDKNYADLWTTLHPKDPGYTWNIEESGMAKKGSFKGEASRRIDRILLRSSTWKAGSIRIVGDKPLKEGDKSLFPSDHFGLVGTLVR